MTTPRKPMRDHARRDATDSAQARTDRRRQQATKANEEFKNL